MEEYVLTRFPSWKVSFHNAGVGGDRVTGGGAGPIDLRLDRDVFAWHPNVISIMLGMNDFFYRPDEPGIYSTYTGGYRHLVDSLKKNDPGVRITLIEPSPYDDVTHKSSGNNDVLLKYSAFVAQLAKEQGAQVADFNTPVTDVLKTVYAASPALASQIIPDRVHPQEGGHWIMTESLLKSWQAPSLVTSVTIDAGGVKPTVEAANTTVTDLTRAKGKISGKISWTQADKALPLPFPPSEIDPVLALVLKYSDIVAALDQAKQQGKARFTGISSHDHPFLKTMIEQYPAQMEVVLFPYTSDTKELPKDSVFEAIRKHNVGVLGIKPFGSNTLFNGDGSLTSPFAVEDARLARMAIRYILQNPAITAPIPGMINTAQVDNVVRAVQEHRKLDTKETAQLREANQRMWASLPEHYQWLKGWEYV